jgi:hypothetical protein
MSSCNSDEIFQGELYKKVVALVSSDEYNVFEESHELTGGESVGYIAASCGGTDATVGDIVIELEEDPAAYNTYNRSLYDTDVDKYARLLPHSMYDIDDYRITIPAGERGGRMKIRVRPEGLSPDSVYFVSLKATFLSAYELNISKSTVLYQVLIRNRYADQKPLSTYSVRGNRSGVDFSSVKTMYPLSRNSVRVPAGISEELDFKLGAIVLEVGEDNHVTIRPYGTIWMEQIEGDDDYPNKYMVEDDGFKLYNNFRIHYRYRIGDDEIYEMKEELRLEIKE